MKKQYTSEELVELLRQRQGNLTLKQFAAEIQISFQMLSDIFRGARSVGNERVLAYLAGKKRHFECRDVYILVSE